MKPGILAVAAVAVLAIGALTYQSSVLRDSMKEEGFGLNVNQTLEKGGGETVATIRGSSIETRFKVEEEQAPSVEKVRQVISRLEDAINVAGNQSQYAIRIGYARSLLKGKKVSGTKIFNAQVYCGEVRQFRDGDDQDEAGQDCDFSTGGQICYKGDMEQARDLINYAVEERRSWYNGGENTFRVWIHDGGLYLTSRNTDTPMGRVIIRSCR